MSVLYNPDRNPFEGTVTEDKLLRLGFMRSMGWEAGAVRYDIEVDEPEYNVVNFWLNSKHSEYSHTLAFSYAGVNEKGHYASRQIAAFPVREMNDLVMAYQMFTGKQLPYIYVPVNNSVVRVVKPSAHCVKKVDVLRLGFKKSIKIGDKYVLPVENNSNKYTHAVVSFRPLIPFDGCTLSFAKKGKGINRRVVYNDLATYRIQCVDDILTYYRQFTGKELTLK